MTDLALSAYALARSLAFLALLFIGTYVFARVIYDGGEYLRIRQQRGEWQALYDDGMPTR